VRQGSQACRQAGKGLAIHFAYGIQSDTMTTMTYFPSHQLDYATRQLQHARLAAGLSLRELAARAGTSHATLLAYEQGKKVPSVTTFLRILEAAGYGVDIRLNKRIRERDGIPRGEELEAVLRLAEQFPTRVSKRMAFPVWPKKL
jgi:transcriptional regulator with XRE-family HTH domain